MRVDNWRLLREGTQPGVVLAVDFESGRPEPGFRDLAPLLDTPFSVLQPLPPGREAGRTVDAYLADWLGTIDRHGLRIVTVLGYCAGSSLACALAAQLRGPDGAGPAVLLLDPDTVSGSMLYYQFMLAVQQFEDVIPERDMARAQQGALAACRDQDLTTAGLTLSDDYAKVAGGAFAEFGLDDEVGQELCDRFGQYLDYLVVAGDARYGGADDAVRTVLSEEYQAPAGLPGTVSRFPVSHLDLLSDPAVAAFTIDTILTAARRSPGAAG